MNKAEFLAELRQRLSGLPQGELEERLAFYGEMIDDRLEDGAAEEEAVASLGTPEEVADQVLAEVPMSALIRERVRPKKKRETGKTVLIVLGFPIWFSLLAAVLAVGFSLYLCLWVLVVSLWIVALSLAASALGCLIGGAVFLFRFGPGEAGLALGGCLVCAGLAVLMAAASLAATRGTARLTMNIWSGLKSRLARKEEAE